MPLGVRAVAVLVVAAVALVAGGLLLGRYFETPDDASLRQPPRQVAVTDRIRTEVLERSVVIGATIGPTDRTSPSFAPGKDGRIVTSIRLKVGRSLTPGSVALEIEGRPIIVLKGSFPAWRDFSTAMSRGRDVVQLQKALADLGIYHERTDGRLGPITLKALRRLYRSVGYAPPSKTVFSHDELLFVPAGLRMVERVDVKVGDRLQSASITLASESRRFEADLSVDQIASMRAGTSLRLLGPGAPAWSTTIDRIVAIDQADGTSGPTAAILTTGPIPEALVGEQTIEVVLASTRTPVLSASPSAIQLSEAGAPFVVLLTGREEHAVPVRVGVVADTRVEISPVVAGALSPGDELVLSPR